MCTKETEMTEKQC